MTSKIRLLGDFLIQVILITFFIALAYNYPANGLAIGSCLIVLISIWQIIYALYMVKQHNSWEKLTYLKQIKLICAYLIFSLLVCGGIYCLSFGLLAGFSWFMLQIFGGIFLIGFSILALYQFCVSAKNLYLNFQRNYSFWDIK